MYSRNDGHEEKVHVCRQLKKNCELYQKLIEKMWKPKQKNQEETKS